MKKNKIFVLGGRSGTCLMIRLLIKGIGFKNYTNKHNGEPEDIRQVIRTTYPDIPNNIFNTGQKGWQVSKLPFFDFIIDKIIEIYKNPIFIVMERNIDDIIKSYLGVHWDNLILREFNLYPKLKKPIVDYFKREPKNDVDSIYMWERFLIHLREKSFSTYNKKNIFRIDFNDFMNNFDNVMRRLCRFLNIKPNIRKFNRLRTRQYSPSTYSVMNYIRDANAKKEQKKKKKKERG